MSTSQRADVSLPFDAPTPLAALAGGDHDVAPYLVGTELWFSRKSSSTTFDIFHVSLAGAGATPVPETQLNAVNTDDGNPVVSADGLTVFFVRGGVGLMEARRATLQTPFCIRDVPELNAVDAGGGTPSWLSPDGCRPYLTSNSISPGYGIRVASRCAP